jgi:hypothetical protein
MKRYAFLLTLLCLHDLLMAARPFVTDDARLTNAGQCQLESWSRKYRSSTEYWALPACNPFGNFEVSLGTGVAYDAQGVRSQDYIIQGKTLVRKLSTDDWGWGVAFGRVMHPAVHPGPNLLGNTYAYIPVSRSWKQDDIIVHVNVGWLKDKASRENKMTWGLGSEFKLTPQLTGIAEAFGDRTAPPYAQAGFRYAIRPDLFQIDMTWGRQQHDTGDNRWLSFGIRYTP